MELEESAGSRMLRRRSENGQKGCVGWQSEEQVMDELID